MFIKEEGSESNSLLYPLSASTTFNFVNWIRTEQSTWKVMKSGMRMLSIVMLAAICSSVIISELILTATTNNT
jgi:hypothetical protein